MRWNWTQPDWPNFRYDSAAVEQLERRFLLSSGEILGAVRHVTGDERDRPRIELLSEEAMRTSAIEGEVLDRASVQSSLRRQFGLSSESAASRRREQGVAEMMVDVYSTYAAPLTPDPLSRWHGMLLAHDCGLETIGAYRRHADPSLSARSASLSRNKAWGRSNRLKTRCRWFSAAPDKNTTSSWVSARAEVTQEAIRGIVSRSLV